MCPSIEPDFSQVIECAPGKYEARVTDAEIKMTQKGQKRIVWRLEIENNSEPALNGRKLNYGTMLEGAGAGMLKAFIRAAGDPNYSGGKYDTDTILGQSVVVVVVDGKDTDGNLTGFPEVKSVSRLK